MAPGRPRRRSHHWTPIPTYYMSSLMAPPSPAIAPSTEARSSSPVIGSSTGEPPASPVIVSSIETGSYSPVIVSTTEALAALESRQSDSETIQESNAVLPLPLDLMPPLTQWIVIQPLLPKMLEQRVLTKFSCSGTLEIEKIEFEQYPSGAPTGLVYIKYTSHGQAQRAVDFFNGSRVEGWRITAALDTSRAEPRRPNSKSVVTIFHWPERLLMKQIVDLLRHAGPINMIGFRPEPNGSGRMNKTTTVHFTTSTAAARAMFLFHGWELFIGQRDPPLLATVHSLWEQPEMLNCDAMAIPTNPDSASDDEATNAILVKDLPNTMSLAELKRIMDAEGEVLWVSMIEVPGQDGLDRIASVQFGSMEKARQVRKLLDGTILPRCWMHIQICFDQHQAYTLVEEGLS